MSLLGNNGDAIFVFVGDDKNAFKSFELAVVGVGDEKNKSNELTGDERLP